MKSLNERQKAILKLASFDTELLNDWKKIYLLANSNNFKETLQQSALKTNISHFKNNPLVKDYLTKELQQRQKEKDDFKSSVIAEYITNTDKIELKDNEKLDDLTEFEKNLRIHSESGKVFKDFKTKGVLLSELNEILNRCKSDNDKLPFLKMITDLLQFKKESENKEIQRFYIPLTCKTCQLYIINASETDKTPTI